MRSASRTASSSMRDVDRTHRAIGEQADKILHQQFAGLRIQRRQRLVHQQDRRPHRERARNADALAHAAGQLLWVGAAKIGQPRAAQRIIDHRATLARAQRSMHQRKFDILFHRAPGQQRKILEHEGQRIEAARRRRAAQFGRARRSAAATRPGSTAACSCRSRTDRRSPPPRPTRTVNDTPSSTSSAPKRWQIWSAIRSIEFLISRLSASWRDARDERAPSHAGISRTSQPSVHWPMTCGSSGQGRWSRASRRPRHRTLNPPSHIPWR